jgi:type II secretory pathway component PulM
MIAALARGLAGRSRRERVLLALLAGVVIPAAFVVLAALPLQEQRAAARAAVTEAEATRDWYLARQTEIAELPGQIPEAAMPRIAPVGLGGIEARLIDAGLRDAVTLLANAQGASVSLTLSGVRFEALMAWIEGIESEAGYRLAALRLERGEDGGLVDADLALEPRR